MAYLRPAVHAVAIGRAGELSSPSPGRSKRGMRRLPQRGHSSFRVSASRAHNVTDSDTVNINFSANGVDMLDYVQKLVGCLEKVQSHKKF